MEANVCCFFGHRKIEVTEALRVRVGGLVRRLVTDEGVDTFLFGSKSGFDDLCHEVVSEVKLAFPHLKRIYVRAEFPYIVNSALFILIPSMRRADERAGRRSLLIARRNRAERF